MASHVAETMLDEGYLGDCDGWLTDFGAIHGNPSVNVPEASWDKHPRGVTFIGGKLGAMIPAGLKASVSTINSLIVGGIEFWTLRK